MPIIRQCDMPSCTIMTMGQYCMDHEHDRAKGDEDLGVLEAAGSSRASRENVEVILSTYGSAIGMVKE
jgi:hypothetical protein